MILTLYCFMAFLQHPSSSPSQVTLGKDSQLPHPPTASTSKDLAKDQEHTQSAISSTPACRPLTAEHAGSAAHWKISLNAIMPAKMIPSCSECFYLKWESFHKIYLYMVKIISVIQRAV